MTIEVRQLVIKSQIEQDGNSAGTSANDVPSKQSRESCFDPELLRRELLADCRKLILEMFAERSER